jgi:hypothetical protein
MGIGLGRLAVALVAVLVAAGGIGAAIGKAVSGPDSVRALDTIDLRKDDPGDEPVDDDWEDPDGDGTRGADGTRGGIDTGGNGQTVGDGDRTRGDDGSGGGDNTRAAPAPAPNGSGDDAADDGGGTDG